MNHSEELVEQHAALLRRFEETEALLGKAQGVGWDDCVDCDMARFRAALAGFLRDLRVHEAAETRALGRVFDATAEGRRKMRQDYAKSHEALDNLVNLLSTAAAVDHGEHVYAVRTITSRVRQALEAHFAYEELEILPLIARQLVR